MSVVQLVKGSSVEMFEALDRFGEWLGLVTYKPDWGFLVATDGDRPYLQVTFKAPDVDQPQSGNVAQRGRKWFLSTYMTKSEVVQTALKAVLTAEEHEAREWFQYGGRAIYGPHLDVNALWDAADTLDARQAPPQPYLCQHERAAWEPRKESGRLVLRLCPCGYTSESYLLDAAVSPQTLLSALLTHGDPYSIPGQKLSEAA